MSNKISVAELRANLDHSDEECRGECVAMFARGTILALVEAVEAAHDALDSVAQHVNWDEVNTAREKLARFDFGGEG